MVNISSTTGCAAKSMSRQQKQNLAVQALAKAKSKTELAAEHGVSRQFIRKEQQRLETVVKDHYQDSNSDVLFMIPVTSDWIEQLFMGLGLIARASYREIIYFMDSLLYYPICIGKISGIFKSAIASAQSYHTHENLSSIRVATNDELYHLNKPILTGVDAHSLYCFILSQENQRDEQSWAIHFLDTQEKGLDPEVMISDEAKGLLAGFQFVFPDCKCYYDNFHLSRSLMDLRRFYRNRLKSTISTVEKLNQAIISGKRSDEKAFDDWALSMDDQTRYTHLSSTIDTLVSWLEHDVLNKAGSPVADREMLYDFIVEQFKALEFIESHRIRDIRITLENKKATSLAFVKELEVKFDQIARQHNTPLEVVWDISKSLRCSMDGDRYAIESIPFQDQLGERYDEIEDAVIEAMSATERTSSMCENMNGRVRKHIAFRQDTGHGYLDLLRFFMNHKPIERSTREHRQAKTPAEILCGESHSHWLEILGYTLFKRTA